MYYSDDDIIDISSGEEDDYIDDDREDLGLAEEDDIKPSQKVYVVLKEEDIRKHQRDEIERVSTAFSISQTEAIVLLLHYHWRVDKVEDDWFTDEEKVRKTVGILKEIVIDLNGKDLNIECGIFFEPYTLEEITKVYCGHPYCITCWTGYISTKINNGSECLRVKCPEPSCSAAVGQDMILKVSKDEDKKKYYRYFLRSYVEEGEKKIKWCPSPGCEYAIDFSIGSASDSSYDVSCLCSNSFCWNCTEEAHRPVDCDMVAKWIFKNKDESENTTWILGNSKPCPKCKRPIEKNMGCMHMTCSAPCRFEFCWLCLGPYNDHRSCHKFDEAEKRREMAKSYIDRYAHYYERWASNQTSRTKAMKDLENLQSGQLKELSDKQCIPETHLQFTVEAWLQIIECRRVLKWTYAYGYCLPDHEEAKRKFFEYLQGEAETGLERLHNCAEVELKQFISKSTEDPSINKTEDPPINFTQYRIKLVELTVATKTYFQNLVKALENGLAEVGIYDDESKQINNNI